MDIGDYVVRKSYEKDITFKIIDKRVNEDGKEEVIKYANYIASQRKYEDVKKESLNA